MKLRYLILLGATLLAVPAQAGQWRDGRYWPDPPNRGGHADLRGEWADLTQSNEAIADGCQSEDATIKGPWPDRHLDRPDCVAVRRLVQQLYAFGCEFGAADGWWCPEARGALHRKGDR